MDELKHEELSERDDIINFTDPALMSVDGYPQWLLDRLEWFRDMRFGMIMHWGLYSIFECTESWSLVPEDAWARPDSLKAWAERKPNLERFQQEYWALNKSFNPSAFDPEQWASLAEDAGFKYLCFTTKHHDGFCLFDTKTTDYRVTHPDCPFSTNPRANIVKEVFDAFRKRDMAISCYFSKSDWHQPDYWDPERPFIDRNPNYDTQAEPEKWEKFVQFVHRQIEELMTGYGPIDVLWLDGGQVRPPLQDVRMDEIAAMARRHQPGLIMADRTVGGINENIITPEQMIPTKPIGFPWESCVTLGEGWSYRTIDSFKSARFVIHMLVDTISKDGNLLLNVAPSPDGSIPAGVQEQLKEIGDWLRINGEAVYSTRAIAPYGFENLRYTSKGKTVYVHILAGEGDETPPESVTLGGLDLEPDSEIRLLGTEEPLTWRQTEKGAEVSVPQSGLPCRNAWVLKASTKQGDLT